MQGSKPHPTHLNESTSTCMMSWAAALTHPQPVAHSLAVLHVLLPRTGVPKVAEVFLKPNLHGGCSSVSLQRAVLIAKKLEREAGTASGAVSTVHEMTNTQLTCK